MVCIRGTLAIVVTLGLVLCGEVPGDSETSPRYELYGRAKVVEVASPNLIRIRLIDRPQAVTVRLLGVGSPRNRERIRDVEPEVLHYIRSNNLWEVSRSYVQGIVRGKVVDVWARKWNPLDEKNRLLAYLVAPHPSRDRVDVNAEIIRKGLGFVTRDYVHVTYANYRRLERQARNGRRGMWRALSDRRISALHR